MNSGAATAGQTVALVYYHQFFVDFAYSVIGGGTAYVFPLGLVHGVRGSRARAPRAGSTRAPHTTTRTRLRLHGVERWFTSTPVGVVVGGGRRSARPTITSTPSP